MAAFYSIKALGLASYCEHGESVSLVEDGKVLPRILWIAAATTNGHVIEAVNELYLLINISLDCH